MAIEFDALKRKLTLEKRGLDFAHCGRVFAGAHFTELDDRNDYKEDRFITIGFIDARLVVVVWTPRGENHRIISLRKANDRERERFEVWLRRELGGP